MKNETIVDRVVERLKSQPLGDLITEEDLHEIVKSAIPKVFFEPTIELKHSGYGSPERVTGDPVLVKIMRDLLKPAVEKLVAEWVSENQTILVEHWRKVIDTGLMIHVAKLQGEASVAPLRAALSPMIEAINTERRRAGLADIYL